MDDSVAGTDKDIRGLIDCAMGRRPADLVLTGGRVVNVVSNEIVEGDIGILGDRIVGVGLFESCATIDLKGRYVCPGFIDAHVHIESSLLSVPEYAQVVVACGTTAVVADPHEFANVMGAEGISFVLRTAKNAPIDVFVMLSSCVPASPFESAGAELNAEDLEPFLANPWVLGLAEMMNYPGVISASEDVLEKLQISRGKVIDGHAPSLSGPSLTAYSTAGIMSDHECIAAAEAREKLRCGLHIMIREGSQTRNLKALLPLVTPATAERFMFCTDDKDVRDLLEEGHIDFMIRTAVGEGLDPILAVRLATYSTARYFGLRDRGAILPGYRADLTVVEDLASCRVTDVFRRGQQIVEKGALVEGPSKDPGRRPLRSSINTHWIEPAEFEIPAPDDSSGAPPEIHVIHVLENRIDTERSVEAACVRDGRLIADSSRDLAKMVVVERHRASGEIGRGFVRGFHLQAGAIASTVAHDAHNLIVVGMSDEDMHAAVIRLIKCHGGLVVVRDGQVLAEVPLPIAGLVGDRPARQMADELCRLSDAAKQLGCRLDQPFMALSFLSLSVIGKLKLTNLGLIDVEEFRAIPLVVGN